MALQTAHTNDHLKELLSYKTEAVQGVYKIVLRIETPYLPLSKPFERIAVALN